MDTLPTAEIRLRLAINCSTFSTRLSLTREILTLYSVTELVNCSCLDTLM